MAEKGRKYVQSCSKTMKPVLMVGILVNHELKVSMTDWAVAVPPGMFHYGEKRDKARVKESVLVHRASKGCKYAGQGTYVVGIKILGPDRGLVSELGSNSADTVINIAIRRTPVQGRDTNGVKDGLLSPLELSNDLLIGHVGHRGVRPGVDGNVVALLVGALQGGGETDGAGSDDEQSSLLVVGQEVIIETERVRRWAIYIVILSRVGVGKHYSQVRWSDHHVQREVFHTQVPLLQSLNSETQ